MTPRVSMGGICILAPFDELQLRFANSFSNHKGVACAWTRQVSSYIRRENSAWNGLMFGVPSRWVFTIGPVTYLNPSVRVVSARLRTLPAPSHAGPRLI